MHVNFEFHIDWKQTTTPSSPLTTLFAASVLVCSLTITGGTGTTRSFSQQFKSWWKDTTATSDLISMVGRSLEIDCFILDVFHLVLRWREMQLLPVCLCISKLKMDSAFDRGSCGNWNEPWYSQYWCHLWDQYGKDLLLLLCVSGWMRECEMSVKVSDWKKKWFALFFSFSGLYSNYLPSSAMAWLQAGFPRKRERQSGWTSGVTAVDPWHLHPRLQALLPAWCHGGKPPHTHLQQWNSSLCPSVDFFFPLVLSVLIWYLPTDGTICATKKAFQIQLSS